MPQDANRTTASESQPASSALTLYAGEGAGPSEPTTAALSTAPSTEVTREADPGSSMVRRIDSAAMEVSAAQLVDEVFEDIDGLLDGSPTRGNGPYAPLGGPSFTTNVFIPPAAQSADSSPALNSVVMLWGLFPAIMGGLCLGLALAFGIATGGRQAAPPNSEAGQTLSSDGNPDIAPETSQFLAYLDQSLDNIEDPAAGGNQSALPVPTIPELTKPAGGGLTTATPFAGTNPQLLAPPVNVPVAALPPLPTVPVQRSPLQAPAPAPVAPPAPAPSPAAPPAAPAATEAAPQTSPSSAAPTPAAPVENISPSPHVLVGLLQLGDRSAAIFEFDDGARRIRVGEAIGSSGWSLVSISQDEAVIRRNGDVRSIYIGQRI